MTRLALAFLLLALLVPAGAPAGGHAAARGEASIFYYPWYGTPQRDGSYLHWDQNGHIPPLDLASSYYPARGPYSGADPAVVRAQMRDIAGAGVREVVSSWWGWGSLEDQRLPMIVSMATKQGLEVAVQIEPYANRSAASVASDVAHLRLLGISRFYVYHPFDGIDEASWAALLTSLPGIQVLAQTVNVARAQAARFAGVYTYDIVTFGPATFGQLCVRAHRAGLICAPSVGPGYDALRATGDTHLRPRNGGATYDAMWQAAIQARADRITITSYNEWHEGTQIEPALARFPRRLAVAHGPATSPITVPYSSYDGAYGLHGTRAARAYLVRTAYWTALYRDGGGTATRTVAVVRKAAAQGFRKAAAQGRNHGFEVERGVMVMSTSAVCSLFPSGSRGCLEPAVRSTRPYLHFEAAASRLMPAVRVTGSDTVGREPGRDAPIGARRGSSRRRACCPQALLERSVVMRCADFSGGPGSSRTRAASGAGWHRLTGLAPERNVGVAVRGVALRAPQTANGRRRRGMEL